MAEYAVLMCNRENLYRLLGRLYRSEVDEELLARMAELRFPTACGDPELDAGYHILTEYLRDTGPDPLTDLAVDYAAVFLGAGIAEGTVAYPYESVYTSPERLVMQDAWEQVTACYRTKGLDKAGTTNIPEDHIALELEFMAHLCADAARLIAARDMVAFSAVLQEQRDFLTHHLLNWAPAFCADVLLCARTGFYQAVAHMTGGYLRLERALITELDGEMIAGI